MNLALVEASHSETTDVAPSFEELVEGFAGRIRAFLAVRLRDPATVDDLAQEVFLTAYRKWSTFNPTRPPYPWLRGIAVNLLRNERRKSRPDPLSCVVDAVAKRWEERGDLDPIEALRSCLERLASRSARLVDARYVRAVSIQDLAEQEGKTCRAMSMELVRVRKKLAACIQARIGEQA